MAKLYVVGKTFEMCRRFCAYQGLHPLYVPMLSTDAQFLNRGAFYPEDGDWVVRYGPWQEGRFTQFVMDQFSHVEPVIVDAYMLDESIEYPKEIFERYRA
jgi:hypothetical protein